jgi:hypothetical protein
MAPGALNKVKGTVTNKIKDLQDLIKSKTSGGGGGGGGGGMGGKVAGGFKKVKSKIPGLKKGSSPASTKANIKDLPKRIFTSKRRQSSRRYSGEPSFGVQYEPKFQETAPANSVNNGSSFSESIIRQGEH